MVVQSLSSRHHLSPIFPWRRNKKKGFRPVKWGLLSRNPSDFVELPKVPHKEYRVLSPEEAARFLKVAATKPHGPIFELALWTGMRPEEYLALQWSDIDLSKGTARIRPALVRHKKRSSLRNRRQREVGVPSICHSR
jgi:integrase